MSVFMALACDQPPRPRQLNFDVPTELDELIMRLLAKAPAQRPHSARAVGGALSRLAAPPRSAIPPVPPDFDDRGAIWLPGPSVALPAGRPRQANPPPLREREPSRAALPGSIARETYLSQLRLLLEELSCDLCRFGHVTRDGVPPEGVEIRREFPLGIVGAYADLRVAVPGQLPYLVEIKFGYSAERLLQSFRRKYGEGAASSNRSTVTFAASPAGRPGNRLARGDANWLTEIRTERRNDQCL